MSSQDIDPELSEAQTRAGSLKRTQRESAEIEAQYLSQSDNPLAGKGQIQVIFGPMFSGKTTELLRRIVRFTIAKLDCAVIKYKADTRYAVEEASTHDQRSIKAIPCELLSDVYHQVKTMDVIGIDEGQFFPDIVAFTERLANEGKIIIVAALDGTFQRKPFGNILELVPLAESVHKLSAVCMECFNPAAFSKRIGSDQRVQVIGGSETYLAVCRRCFHSLPLTPHSPGKLKKARMAAQSCQLPASSTQLFQ